MDVKVYNMTKALESLRQLDFLKKAIGSSSNFSTLSQERYLEPNNKF